MCVVRTHLQTAQFEVHRDFTLLQKQGLKLSVTGKQSNQSSKKADVYKRIPTDDCKEKEKRKKTQPNRKQKMYCASTKHKETSGVIWHRLTDHRSDTSNEGQVCSESGGKIQQREVVRGWSQSP